MGMLDRFRESRAARCIEAALGQEKPPEEAVFAARQLREIGAERCVPILCNALLHGPVPLQIEAALALAAIHQRFPDKRILEALHGALLHERKAEQVRQAAIEGLVELIDVRHAGSLLEVLKSNRSPMAVRSAALRGLKKLGYSEVVERLVESFLFGKRLDPAGEIRKWAVRELIAVDDPDKLTKIFEIAHGRRKLRYRAVSPEAGGPAALVLLMARVDPRASVRLLNQMADDSNPAIRAAAAKALQSVKGRAAEPPPAP